MIAIDYSEEQDAIHINHGDSTYGENDYVKIGEAGEDAIRAFAYLVIEKYKSRKYPGVEVMKQLFREFMGEVKIA